jgi:iron complex transport system substrate-binding protein
VAEPRRPAGVPLPAYLLLLLGLLVGCSGSGSGPSVVAAGAGAVVPVGSPVPELPVMVTGADGRRATVTDASRVVAVNLSGTLAEVVFALGLGDRVVGRDVATTFPEAAHLPLVTRAHDLSAEGVLALDPTVLLTDASTGPPEAITAIREAGVPVVVVPEAWSLEAVAPRIEAVAEALGVPAAGRALVERTVADVEAAVAAAPRAQGVKVAFLYLRGTAGVYLIGGRGSGADSLVEAFGAVDAGSAIGVERFRPLTSEGLVRAAPDVLVLMSGGLESVGGEDGLLGVAGVAQTPAGEHRRFVTVDDGRLLSFGPRTGEVVRLLASRVAEEMAS